jgi:CheY-like chemotaxis protein
VRGFSIPPGDAGTGNIAGVSGSVLIVDDDAEFRGLARRMLTDAGLTVTGEAGAASAALTVARASRPDGILVDLRLAEPDSDGLALARALVRLEWGPRVLLTSSEPAYEGMLDDCAELAFVAKADLPNAPLRELLGR